MQGKAGSEYLLSFFFLRISPLFFFFHLQFYPPKIFFFDFQLPFCPLPHTAPCALKLNCLVRMGIGTSLASSLYLYTPGILSLSLFVAFPGLKRWSKAVNNIFFFFFFSHPIWNADFLGPTTTKTELILRLRVHIMIEIRQFLVICLRQEKKRSCGQHRHDYYKAGGQGQDSLWCEWAEIRDDRFSQTPSKHAGSAPDWPGSVDHKRAK